MPLTIIWEISDLSPIWNTEYYRNYRAGYAQDDWKVNSKLTVNMGVRYDYIQPYSSKAGDAGQLSHQLARRRSSRRGNQSGHYATGTANYVLPAQSCEPISCFGGFITELANDNVNLDYTNANPHSLVSVQHYNFAPRIGFAYQVDPKTVVRAAYGLFYGAIESPGGSRAADKLSFAYNNGNCTIHYQELWRVLSIHQAGYNNHQSQCPSNGTPDLSVE